MRHTGYSDRALRARKLVRDARILRDELDERPDDPFVLFNLGAIAIERQEWREALGLLRRSLAGSAPTDSITRKLFALIARAHQMLGEPRQALAACAAGLELDPDDAELIFRKAVIRAPDGRRRRGRGGAGSGSSPSAGPSSSPASTKGSTATSPAATSPPWPPSGATTTRRRGSGASARRMPRRPGGAGEAAGSRVPAEAAR